MIARISFLAVCLINVITLQVNVESKAIGNEISAGTTPEEFSVGTTTEDSTQKTATDTVSLQDGERVTLAIPDELFSSTGILSLRLSEVIGPFIMRSVARLAQVTRFIQPLFGGNLEIKIPKDLD
ncbi:uncharacterized protein LOC129768146 [Toxorhynchites rutilus septentrionalis]|uniref:uncharacterized protein LOC129768146 n=1 Tax=Toxorhynchites rutilus septentrionalis TaxID=329112 RepID=UPI002478B994|nr:uncharacterized protein LOC129768146 [Toxorhynchites rutilus septentrionalis]